MQEHTFRVKTNYGYATVRLIRNPLTDVTWRANIEVETGDELFQDLRATTWDDALDEVNVILDQWEIDTGGSPI